MFRTKEKQHPMTTKPPSDGHIYFHTYRVNWVQATLAPDKSGLVPKPGGEADYFHVIAPDPESAKQFAEQLLTGDRNVHLVHEPELLADYAWVSPIYDFTKGEL
jgi:hypothetical protein